MDQPRHLEGPGADEDPDEILATWVEAANEEGKQQRQQALRRVEESAEAAIAVPVAPTYTNKDGFVFRRDCARPFGKKSAFDDQSERPRAKLQCFRHTGGCNTWVNLWQVRSHKHLEQWLCSAEDYASKKSHLDVLDRMVLVSETDQY